MKLKELINKSWYGTVGTISKEQDLLTLGGYIEYNLPVLKEYKNIIVVTNYNGDWQEQNTALWKSYFPECVIIDLEQNRGHGFGTADADNAVIDYCKENNIDWVCKVSNDIIISEEALNIQIEEADFYYLEGIGYGGMEKYDFNFDRIKNDDFYPQTNFYFINTSKIDYLYDKEYVDKTYNESLTLPNYSGRTWEHWQDWTCEHVLLHCVERNNLSKYHLMSNTTFDRLLNVVKQYNIHDCSHKNLMIEGICHFHYSNHQITLI